MGVQCRHRRALLDNTRGDVDRTIASISIVAHDPMRAQRADAGGVAQVASVARMLHAMNDARIPVMSI